MKVEALKCKGCNAEYDKAPKYVCDMCFGPLEVKYDWELIRKNTSIKKNFKWS